jgi:hypothetical protein
MIAMQRQTLNEISLEAIHLLCHQLGIVKTLRFLNQFTIGFGNYTEEREAIFENMSLDEIVAEIKQARDFNNETGI